MSSVKERIAALNAKKSEPIAASEQPKRNNLSDRMKLFEQNTESPSVSATNLSPKPSALIPPVSVPVSSPKPSVVSPVVPVVKSPPTSPIASSFDGIPRVAKDIDKEQSLTMNKQEIPNALPPSEAVQRTIPTSVPAPVSPPPPAPSVAQKSDCVAGESGYVKPSGINSLKAKLGNIPMPGMGRPMSMPHMGGVPMPGMPRSTAGGMHTRGESESGTSRRHTESLDSGELVHVSICIAVVYV